MKKNTYIVIFIFITSLYGCNMSKYYLKKGDYDMATKEAVKKLRKNKNKEKQIIILNEAYPKAQKMDRNKIDFLHKEGEPDRWEKIFHLYSDLETRQVLVEGVTPLFLNGEKITFPHVDYDELLIEAKLKAAAYYYAHAKKLMEQNSKYSYREAYEEFKKVKSYTSSYSDVDDLLTECYNNGIAYVGIVGVNNTQFKLPKDFMINLIDFPTEDLNSFWVKYYSRDSRNGNYDIFVNVTLNIADISGNNINKTKFVEKKEVSDGWEYELDPKGRVVTDSLGNPVKIIKYKEIVCNVIVCQQLKHAYIEGKVNYLDRETNQIIRSVPIAAEHTFEHVYYKADGNLKALSNETRDKLDIMPMPFPLDIEMMYAANETLRNVIYQVLLRNKIFIKQKY